MQNAWREQCMCLCSSIYVGYSWLSLSKWMLAVGIDTICRTSKKPVTESITGDSCGLVIRRFYRRWELQPWFVAHTTAFVKPYVFPVCVKWRHLHIYSDRMTGSGRWSFCCRGPVSSEYEPARSLRVDIWFPLGFFDTLYALVSFDYHFLSLALLFLILYIFSAHSFVLYFFRLYP